MNPTPAAAAVPVVKMSIAPSAITHVAPTSQPLPVPQTFMQMHASWLTHTVAGVFVLAAIGLIFLLAIQTTKQEGLSGTIGGRVESAYRGRVGADEQLKRLTGWVAGIFVFCALILSLTGI